MSYATGTTHYNLPQTVGSDKRDWTDTNQAFSDLDTAVYGAAQGAEAATSAIQTINSELDVIAEKQATDEENITTLNGKVSTLESTTSTLGAEVLDVRQDLQDNIESKHEASATSTHAYAIGDTFYYNDILYKATAAIAIGDTIVPTVNCMGITVMSQVSAIKGDLTASDGLGFEFMTDGDGNYGYRGADDSFVPFSHGGGGGALRNIFGLHYISPYSVYGVGFKNDGTPFKTDTVNPSASTGAVLEPVINESDIFEYVSASAYGCTVKVLKAGYYLMQNSADNNRKLLDAYNFAENDTFTISSESPNNCIFIYLGDTNPFA